MNRLSETERAHEEIVRLCKPGQSWRMSIPADPSRDSDLILQDALDALTSRLASVEALGQDGSPESLMEAVRAELTTYLGQGSANLATSRVMHQIRTHIAAVLGSDAHTEQKGTGR